MNRQIVVTFSSSANLAQFLASQFKDEATKHGAQNVIVTIKKAKV